jgi:hypothetical protein
VTKKEFTSYGEDAKKIRIGSFSHSSNTCEIASLINENVFRRRHKEVHTGSFSHPELGQERVCLNEKIGTEDCK